MTIYKVQLPKNKPASHSASPWRKQSCHCCRWTGLGGFGAAAPCLGAAVRNVMASQDRWRRAGWCLCFPGTLPVCAPHPQRSCRIMELLCFQRGQLVFTQVCLPLACTRVKQTQLLCLFFCAPTPARGAALHQWSVCPVRWGSSCPLPTAPALCGHWGVGLGVTPLDPPISQLCLAVSPPPHYPNLTHIYFPVSMINGSVGAMEGR